MKLLGKKLDRRNSQRKIIDKNFENIKEIKKEVAHKVPFYYKFDLKKYKNALEAEWGLSFHD